MLRPILCAFQLEGEIFSLDIPSHRTSGGKRRSGARTMLFPPTVNKLRPRYSRITNPLPTLRVPAGGSLIDLSPIRDTFKGSTPVHRRYFVRSPSMCRVTSVWCSIRFRMSGPGVSKLLPFDARGIFSLAVRQKRSADLTTGLSRNLTRYV